MNYRITTNAPLTAVQLKEVNQYAEQLTKDVHIPRALVTDLLFWHSLAAQITRVTGEAQKVIRNELLSGFEVFLWELGRLYPDIQKRFYEQAESLAKFMD